MRGLFCRDLAVGRRGRLVVDQLTGELPRGSVCALVGPNGAGKSTLLDALAGGATLMAGELSLNGTPLTRQSPLALARLRGYLPQHHSLAFPLLAREVVMLGRRPHAAAPSLHEEVVAATLAAVDATALAARPYTELSGGERQRVQLARVLAQVWEAQAGTRLLLLDEPTAGLDLGHQQLLMRQLRSWAAGGGIVIAALHDLNLALRYCDRIWAIGHGRLLADGPPAAVLTAAFIRELVGAEVAIEPGDSGPWIHLLV